MPKGRSPKAPARSARPATRSRTEEDLGHRGAAKRRATPGGWEKDAACSKEGACSWGRGRAPPHRHCTPRLRSAHLQSSPNAQSLAERIAAPDPKVRVGRGLRASGRGRAAKRRAAPNRMRKGAARKRRAMGRIEHPLLDGSSPFAPTDLRPSLAAPPYHKK